MKLPAKTRAMGTVKQTTVYTKYLTPPIQYGHSNQSFYGLDLFSLSLFFDSFLPEPQCQILALRIA